MGNNHLDLETATHLHVGIVYGRELRTLKPIQNRSFLISGLQIGSGE